MIVYRIAKKKYSSDLSGEGAKLFGGRWNSPGRNVLYTSESVALAALEVLVNLSANVSPEGFQLITIRLPDDARVSAVKLSQLPANWKNTEPSLFLKKSGDNWLKKNHTLVLKVPSAVIPQEYNYLLNPSHDLFQKVKIINISNFSFDKRISLKK
jgi:RES domain-containing protein